MSTSTLVPTAIGWLDDPGATFFGGTGAEGLSDSLDSTGTACDQTEIAESYVTANPPAAAMLIQTVTANMRGVTTGGIDRNVQSFGRNAAGDLVWGIAHLFTVALATFQDVFATAPDTTPWTPAKLTGTQVGIYTAALADAGIQVTELTLTVTWTAFGGFVFFLTSIGPVIGLGMQHMAGIAQAARKKTGILLEPHEYAQALRELRAYPWPKSFLPPLTGWPKV